MSKRLAAALLLLLSAAACNRDEQAHAMKPAPPPPIGDAARGQALAAQYGCNTCHAIPGIEGPQGALGPSLAGVASRPAISFNAVQNTPQNLAKYIQEPGSMNPQSGMPPLGLSEAESKDIAAYLLTLR